MPLTCGKTLNTDGGNTECLRCSGPVGLWELALFFNFLFFFNFNHLGFGFLVHTLVMIPVPWCSSVTWEPVCEALGTVASTQQAATTFPAMSVSCDIHHQSLPRVRSKLPWTPQRTKARVPYSPQNPRVPTKSTQSLGRVSPLLIPPVTALWLTLWLTVSSQRPQATSVTLCAPRKAAGALRPGTVSPARTSAGAGSVWRSATCWKGETLSFQPLSSSEKSPALLRYFSSFSLVLDTIFVYLMFVFWQSVHHIRKQVSRCSSVHLIVCHVSLPENTLSFHFTEIPQDRTDTVASIFKRVWVFGLFFPVHYSHCIKIYQHRALPNSF